MDALSPTPEMRVWRRRTLGWCLLMCVAFAFVVAGGTYYYVQRTSDRLEGARHHSDQQFAKALIVTDRKFRQALKIQTALFAYSTNKSVCTLRPFLTAARTARLAAVRTAKDEKDRKLNQTAADIYKRLIDGQVTVPSDFNCKTLPRNPPKPARP